MAVNTHKMGMNGIVKSGGEKTMEGLLRTSQGSQYPPMVPDKVIISWLIYGRILCGKSRLGGRDFSRKKRLFSLDLVRRRPTRFLPSILPFQQAEQGRAAVKWTVVWQKLRPDRNRGRKGKGGLSGTGVVEHSTTYNYVCFYHDILLQKLFL